MPIGVGLGPDGEMKYVVRGAWCVRANTEPAVTHNAQLTTYLEVESVLDQWQLDDEWWRQRISRRYVEVIVAGGKRMLLFEDLVTGEWFEQTP